MQSNPLHHARYTLMMLLPMIAGCQGANTGNTNGATPVLADGGAPVQPSAAVHVPTGVVVIDAQRTFISTASRRNPGANIEARLENNKRVFELANAKSVPFFVTYEATKSGDGALPPSLASVMPPGAQEFIKTTFAATGQPQFAAAIQASGLRRWVVVGAETDVCVLQTILGLRQAGFEVVAAVDALFTEEVNVRPAIRRMHQAGVETVGMDQVEAAIEGKLLGDVEVADAPPAIVRPLEMGLVLHGFESIGADAHADAKRVRLRELFTISEWFKLPVFATDPAKAQAALPPELRNILTRGIQPLSARPPDVKQLAVLGGNTNIAATSSALRASGAEVFLIEDALLGGSPSDLEPAYVQGAVPSTYKTLYYELTRSVDDREWPSQEWVQDGDRYFDRTLPPEDLPPIPE